MTYKIPVTVVIPIKNEEINLSECLSRLSRFSEVVVVDSQSSDRSIEIAKLYGVEVVQFVWDGAFPKKRNWFLLNGTIKNKWVLFLDADEFVDELFCEELMVKIDDIRYNGFWITYDNFFCGKKLRYGLPQRKLALFRLGAGLYEKIDECKWSALDMEVHEHPMIHGDVGEIYTRVEHNDQSGLSVFMERHRNYAMWESSRYLTLRQAPIESLTRRTRRQRLKYKHIEKWWFPWVYFAYSYVLSRGFLDGAPGFSYAFYKLWYFETVRQLIAEKRRIG